ncbi:hypothetical protein MJG53_009415 [Ovis ammon polii x Ovis aries]|uniref:Uncharacterized protein n=2 Tax=Ovis TaxID=9935 RepID=A0A836A131_SHEEP|nr:hypothetical protein JEQ12_019259 [Ovis aries]KAI4581890.1 hypothetical protein MJG53_009415 [Ovis ammon polii x Ovis aries]
MQRVSGRLVALELGEPGGEHTAAERGKCGLVKPQTFSDAVLSSSKRELLSSCRVQAPRYDAASCVLPLEQLVFCAEIISGNSSTRFQRSREAKAIGGGSKAKTLLSE